MKVKWVLSVLYVTVLLGCSAKPTDQSVQTESTKQIPQQQSSSGDVYTSEYLNSINKPVEAAHWIITLKPKIEEPNHPGFETYNIEFIYEGNSKVTQAKMSAGNGTVNLHDISHGEGGMLGSSVPIGTKQINFSILSTDETGETVVQTLELITGE